jgi:hypothetical protein
MQTALTNLLDNSLNYTDRGGHITLRAEASSSYADRGTADTTAGLLLHGQAAQQYLGLARTLQNQTPEQQRLDRIEKELKENMLEYGRTIKSLKDDESLIIQVTVTKCKGCNIPSTLELTVKGSVLKDFNAGKVDQSTAMTKINVKKGANQ